MDAMHMMCVKCVKCVMGMSLVVPLPAFKALVFPLTTFISGLKGRLSTQFDHHPSSE